MTLKKLLTKHKDSISEVSALAASIYAEKDDIKRVAGTVLRYYALYRNLLKMKPKKSPYYVRVYEAKDHFDKHKYINVSGYKTKPEKESYALEFRPWQEWLGMNVIDGIKDEKKTLAYCLWEMTFIGFDQGTIKGQMNELKRQVKEVESGKAKLIPVDEVFKRIKEKYGIKKKK